MKATVERHQIHSTLRRMGTGVGAAAPMNVNASSGKVDLVAVGKESILHAELDASVKMPGFADVMLRQITSVVKSLPNGKVVLESGGEGVALSGGGTRVVLADPAELCNAGLLEPESPGQRVNGGLLRAALDAVISSTATDNHRIFGSVRFDASNDDLRLVASDTFRLAVRDLPGIPSWGSFSVNAWAIKRMLGAFGKPSEYRIRAAPDYVWFSAEKVGEMGIVCDRSDYPRYQSWSPPWQGRLVCSRTPLADLASRVVALDPKAPAPIKLIFSTEGIEFSAKSPAGMVSGYLEADHQDFPGEVTLRFNSRFLATLFPI